MGEVLRFRNPNLALEGEDLDAVLPGLREGTKSVVGRAMTQALHDLSTLPHGKDIGIYTAYELLAEEFHAQLRGGPMGLLPSK